MLLSELDIKELTLTTAKAEISNSVYHACRLMERLEGVGRVNGNGHHMAQEVSAFAQKFLAERWIPAVAKPTIDRPLKSL